MIDPTALSPEELKRILSEQEKSAQMLVRRDIELARANDQLRALGEQKSRFISVAAHQLRTPLSAIRWSLGYLLSGRVGSFTEEQETLLRQSLDSTIRLVSLVNDLLGVDRLESGRVQYTFGPVDLHDVIQSVLLDIGPNAVKKKVSVEFVNELKRDAFACADVHQVRLVVQNLLENAIKYTEAGGTVTVRLSHDGNTLSTSIADTGIGVPKDQQADIFKQFFRARNAVKVVTDGSGLGLYLTKETIERMGGSITFTSEEYHGSTFSFTLPRYVATAQGRDMVYTNG